MLGKAYQLDFALTDTHPAAASEQRLDVKSIMQETIVMATSRTYAAKFIKTGYSYRHLKNLDYIPYGEHQEAVYKWFKHHFNKVPDTRSFLSVDNVHAVLTAIREGLGLGVVPERLIRKELASGDLLVVTGQKKPLVNHIMLITLKDRVRPPAEILFLQELRSALKV